MIQKTYVLSHPPLSTYGFRRSVAGKNTIPHLFLRDHMHARSSKMQIDTTAAPADSCTGCRIKSIVAVPNGYGTAMTTCVCFSRGVD